MSHSDLGLLGGSEPRTGRGRHSRHRAPQRGGAGRTVAALLIVLLLLGSLIGGVVYGGSRVMAAFGSTPDYSGAGTGSVLVLVKPGDTSSDVARTLVAQGVVKSAKAFVSAALADNRSRTLQPGTYKLHQHMKASLALALLLDPSSRVRSRVTLPEGLTVAQSLVRISQKTGIDLTQLRAAARDTSRLGLPGYARGRLEGFLFPATYDIEPGTSATKALRTMVAKFNEVAAGSQLQQRAAAVHLTPYQAMILASLLQREGRVDSDNPKIARVIYNRLAIGKPLGIDASILYGLGRTSGKLSVTDLAKRTPYNTRLLTGLPPTPIACPGKAATEAALAPTPGNWLYFVVMDKQGRNFFTSDYNSFLRQKASSAREGLL